MFIRHKYVITIYNLTRDTRYVECFSWTRLCLYTQSRRYKQLGAYNRRGLLLYGGGGVTAVWAVLVNICNLEF